MKRKTTVILACLMAAFAVSAAGAAISSATMVLPVFSGEAEEATGSGSATTLHVEGGASIKCEKISSFKLTFEASSRHLGSISAPFISCAEGGETCSGLGSSDGTIETTGTWHLVLRTVGGVDSHLMLFLIGKIHIECPKGAVKLFLVSGDVAGVISQKTGSSTEFVETMKTVNEEGKAQEFSEFENEAGTGVKTKLEIEQEGGKAKTATLVNINIFIFPRKTSIEK
jgi:hypothetical protein